MAWAWGASDAAVGVDGRRGETRVLGTKPNLAA